jgi:hypothetical protein
MVSQELEKKHNELKKKFDELDSKFEVIDQRLDSVESAVKTYVASFFSFLLFPLRQDSLFCLSSDTLQVHRPD